jgi:Uma2 family endonuclease
MVMRELTRRPETVEAFDEWVLLPENLDREYEFVRGRVYDVVSNPFSSKAAVRISTHLGMYLLKNDIGHLTGADGGYRVMGERYIPDAAFISYARQPQLQTENGYNPLPPDLPVEVLSPSNDDEKLRVKVANYVAAGALVWVVDLDMQRVEVYRTGRAVAMFGVEATLDGEDVLPGFRLPVRDIFDKAHG